VVQVGQRVGLYWEMYDEPDPTAPVEISVTVMKARWKVGRTAWTIPIADARFREHFVRVLFWLVATTPLWRSTRRRR
jgi:hypothetical protein